MDKIDISRRAFEDAFKDLTEEAEALRDALRVKDLEAMKIINTPPEVEYDDLTELASVVTGAEFSYINFIDEHNLWIKSKFGGEYLSVSYPRDTVVCNLTIRSTEPFIVNDAFTDDRVSHLKFVSSKMVGSYAGVPILSPCGNPVGTVCAINQGAFIFTERQINSLKIIARIVATMIAKRM
jgi:GAF domain-containing protein